MYCAELCDKLHWVQEGKTLYGIKIGWNHYWHSFSIVILEIFDLKHILKLTKFKLSTKSLWYWIDMKCSIWLKPELNILLAHWSAFLFFFYVFSCSLICNSAIFYSAVFHILFSSTFSKYNLLYIIYRENRCKSYTWRECDIIVGKCERKENKKERGVEHRTIAYYGTDMT